MIAPADCPRGIVGETPGAEEASRTRASTSLIPWRRWSAKVPFLTAMAFLPTGGNGVQDRPHSLLTSRRETGLELSRSVHHAGWLMM